MARRGSEAGFTLIEALVAMAVLAVGAMSLLAATEGHAVRIGAVIDRTAARWAAEARLAELRLGLPASPGPVESYGRAWAVSADSQPTDDPALVRVTVTVAPAVDGRAAAGPLVTLTGYIEAPDGGQES